MNLLVIGGSGRLGRALLGKGTAATYHRRPADVPGVRWYSLDIRNRDDTLTLLRRLRPAVVVNAAFAQHDWATTADGATHVAAAVADVGARLVHVSSDAVFGGRAEPYDERCSPDPATPYGAAKAAAETAVKGLVPAVVIARTSLIVGGGDSVHERRVHDLVSGAVDGALFTDDVRCPVHVTDLAAALLELATSPFSGIHHVAGPDALSRHELGVLIARRDGLDPTRLRAARRAEAGPPGPLVVKLDCAMTRTRLSTRLRGAREFL
ncbi:sugar nucleotide-binding protein [Dactylosporangium sp. CA-233914]|uniref:sugar nucleotide-binding protein n=1 Tax=Dactylosporangium sp. CA-233914 TaxID=3239934 RepID=UPI003D89F44B